MINQNIKTTRNNGINQEKQYEPDMVMKVKLFNVDAYKFKNEGDKERLLSIISSDIFDNITITLSADKRVINNDETLKGNVTVGYVNGYNKETKEFEVSIFNSVAKQVEKFISNPVIYTRLRTKNDKLVIAGFVIQQAR